MIYHRLKFFLRIILPKYLYNLLRKIIRKFSDEIMFIGVLTSENDLKEYLRKKNLSHKLEYRNQELVNQEIRNKQNVPEMFNKDLFIQFRERDTFLCHALTLFNSNNIKVLDIGGGFNPCYFALNYSLNKKIECYVVELENVVEGSKKIYGNVEGLTYSTIYPENRTFDVIYIASSLVRLADLNQLINRIISYKPKLFVITYTLFAEEHGFFVTGQYTLDYKYIVPTTIRNINRFIEILSKNNFKLIHKSLMGSNNYKTFSDLGIKTRTYNLVFEY